jgi:hypothetical protein
MTMSGVPIDSADVAQHRLLVQSFLSQGISFPYESLAGKY